MRWHHGHSLGSGVVGGLLLAGQPALMIFLGIGIGLALARIGAVVRWIGARLARQA